MTENQSLTEEMLVGEVLSIDYDKDLITVSVEGQGERTFPFALFDGLDVYQVGQSFRLALGADGLPAQVEQHELPLEQTKGIPGYVESIDIGDHLAWVYLRDEEGWHRKILPLELFEEAGLARAGRHFILKLAPDGTPRELLPDEAEMELQPQPQDEAKPRWTMRPAAEAEPES